MTPSQKDAAAKLLKGDKAAWEDMSPEQQKLAEDYVEKVTSREGRMEHLAEQQVTIKLTVKELYRLVANPSIYARELHGKLWPIVEEHIPDPDDQEMFEEMFT